MAETEEYLAVLKASYDYEPQSEDEVKIAEDQILFLLERVDDDWWKVKVKGASPDEEGPSGLVPAAYVEPAPHTIVVKAQYEYAAQASGELNIAEDQILHAFGAEEEGWLLVQTEDGNRAGYVPANYVEEAGDGAAAEEETAAPAPSFANIVIPDSPKRPVSTYNDPAELVASTKSAKPTQAPDPVQTWSVSEVDKKGKKKKGTLGVGNGTLFFASESDKAPVQQFPLAQVGEAHLDENKPKHLYVTLGGQEMHFNCGDRDTSEDVLYKLKKSRKAAGLDEDEAAATPAASMSPARSKGVHFAESGPAVIPPSPEHSEDDEPTPTHTNGHAHAEEDDEDGEPAIALYDFQAQGDDELSVDEGDKLWIVERDSEEWWKVRDTKGNEGVVPASYIEPTGPPRAAKPKAPAAPVQDDSDDDNAAQEAAAEAEREAAAAAAARAAERKAKQEAEERKQRERARREAERERAAAEEERRAKEKEREKRAKEKEASHKSKGSIDKRGPPPADKTRVWTDRTGQFRVEAAFLGYKNGMIRLHKVNGVVIEVPSEKMSIEDIAYIDKATNPKKKGNNSDDDEPLATRRHSLISGPSASSSTSSVHKASPQQAPPKKKGPGIDWFEFFLSAGCDIDDCTRYATSFERDKIDAALLPDITESTMRSLGLREGDIIRVRKAISERGPPKPEKDKQRDDADQIARDEEIARALQEGREIPKRSTPSPGAPNLFTTAGGQLKNNTRRGRPTKSSTIPNAVGLDSLSTASETIARTTTPQLLGSPATASPVQQLPPRTSSAAATPPVSSGFDDDAWTNRPSSTKPMTPTPNAQPTRAPSAPPAPAPPPAPAAPTPPPAPPAANVMQRAVSAAPAQQKGLSQTTESDIFDQLARLSQLRVASPAVQPAAPTPPVASPPPAGYAAGLGVGTSPSPLGAHLQAQATGALPPLNGPRGPLAPVPQNQGLLQPLVPTQTGFRGFVPTQPTGFQPQQTGFQPQPTGFQPQGLQPQPTGFQPQGLQTQPTGFNPSAFQSQPTGFQPQPTGFLPQSFQPQQTGFQPQQTGFQPQQTGFQPQLQPQQTGFNPGFGQSQSPPPVPPLPSFAQGGFGGGIQPQPTGFNPGFGQPPPPKDTSPANVFAQMKAGVFGDESAPQGANKYDALRTNTTPLTAQPTGWGVYGAGGFQGGYNGYQG
ncbi:hypothetical protein PENSPDRAFT_653484 [Peniophora sp. CONT]|nr:hypothetical protein PENSPDRAFT_653484 [Peniophora sp. CONT]